MLNKLDPTTVFFLSILTTSVCALVMIFIWYVNRKVKGTLFWLASVVAFTFSTMMFYLWSGEGFSDYRSIILVANELLLLGYLFLLYGIAQFLHIEKRVRFTCVALFILCTPFLLDSLYFNLEFTYSVIVISIIQLIILPFTLSVLWFGFYKSNASDRCLIGTILLFLTISLILPKSVLQLLQVYFSDVHTSLYQPLLLNSITTILTLLLPVLLILSLAILCSERRENELRKLNKVANEGIELRSRFLATMSHEIRTPLNGIMGNAQLLLSDSVTEKNKKRSQTIIDSAESLGDLANNVLEYSRLDMKETPLQEADFDLRESLNDVLRLCQPIADNKEIDLLLLVSDEVKDIYFGDHKKLKQVLINLIGNAIKFTDKGEVSIEVSLDENEGSVESHLDHLLFSVTDTGIGIPEDDHRDLLLPFYQAKNVVNQISGTGLGLAICRTLLATMKSGLAFSSTLGVGSRFYFKLKLYQGNSGLITSSTLESNFKVAKGLAILLVEDIELNQQIAISLLALDKHIVTLASNLSEAIDASRQKKFDFILTDINLPDGKGFDLANLIQAKDSVNRLTPLVAVTARVSSLDLELYKSKGLDYFVPKPVKLQYLRSVLATSICSKDNKVVVPLSTHQKNKRLFNKEVLNSLSRVMSHTQYNKVRTSLSIKLDLYFDQIQFNVANQNLAELNKALHKAAGMSAQLGFESLTELLIQLEDYDDLALIKEELNKLLELKQKCSILLDKVS